MIRIVSLLALISFGAAAAAIGVLPGRAGAAASELIVTPREAYVLPGGSQPFIALLDGSHAAASASWRVIPASLGTIGPDGVFVAADAPGRGLVRVETVTRSGVLVGHALVRVGRGESLPRLRVVPESASLSPGEEIAFRAEGPDGAAPLGAVAWSVDPESAGTIGPDGRFRAGDSPGFARVLAALDEEGERISGMARVWIGRNGGPPPALQIRPESATLAAGDRARFTARLLPPQPDSVVARVRWSFFPETLGRIGPDGVLEAGDEPGEGRVVASLDWESRTLRAFARARVLPRRGAVVLRVEPPAAVLAPGRSIRFDAALLGARIARPDAAPPLDVRWLVSPQELGSIASDGTLTAFTAEAYPSGLFRGEVVAQALVDGAAIEGRAHVRIEAAASLDLDVKPRFVTTAPGNEVRVTAFLGGEPVPAQIPVEWGVVPPTLGTITADGLFTANENFDAPASDEFGRREGVLVARALLPEGKVVRGAARVVIVPHATRAQIFVEPREAFVDLSAGEPVAAVTFRVVTAAGGPEASALAADEAAPRIIWRVRPAGIGAISPNGVFRPSVRFALDAALGGLERVDGRVVAEVRVSPRETLHGEARVIIEALSPVVLDLFIQPARAIVPAGSTLRFSGRIAGQIVSELPLRAEWSVQPLDLGEIGPDGIFTPNPEPPVGNATRAGQVQLGVTTRAGVTRTAVAAVTVSY